MFLQITALVCEGKISSIMCGELLCSLVLPYMWPVNVVQTEFVFLLPLYHVTFNCVHSVSSQIKFIS